MTRYRVAYQWPDGTLGSMRIGLPMGREEAAHAAYRANNNAGRPLEGEGRYVVIDASTEEVLPDA